MSEYAAGAQCTLGISGGWLCCKYVVHTALGDLNLARVDKLIFNKVLRMILDILLRTFYSWKNSISPQNVSASDLGQSSVFDQIFMTKSGDNTKTEIGWTKLCLAKLFLILSVVCSLLLGPFKHWLQQKSFHLKSGGTQISSSLFTDHKVELWT